MIKDKIRDSKLLASVYKQYEDFNHGRAFFGKFTQLSGEVNTILLIVIGWETLKSKFTDLFLFGSAGILFIYLFGKFYRRSNLLEVEQRASANRNPIGKIMLEAAEIIIERFKK